MEVYSGDLIAKAVGILEGAASMRDNERAEVRTKVAMAYIRAAEALGPGNNSVKVARFIP